VYRLAANFSPTTRAVAVPVATVSPPGPTRAASRKAISPCRWTTRPRPTMRPG